MEQELEQEQELEREQERELERELELEQELELEREQERELELERELERELEQEQEREQERERMSLLPIVVVSTAAVVWIVCGVLAYGMTFGHFQHTYRSLASRGMLRSDRLFAAIVAMLGPIGLFAAWRGNVSFRMLAYRSPWIKEGLIR